MLKAMEDCLSSIKVLAFLLNVVAWLSPNAEEIHDHTHTKCITFVIKNMSIDMS